MPKEWGQMRREARALLLGDAPEAAMGLRPGNGRAWFLCKQGELREGQRGGQESSGPGRQVGSVGTGKLRELFHVCFYFSMRY